MRIISAPYPATRHKVKPGTRFLRETCEDIEIAIGDTNIVIPKGFETDFATIPRIFWSVLSPWGRDELAYCCHDFMYLKANKYGFSRYFCDRVMYDLQGQLCSSAWRSDLIYATIRLLGFYRFYQLNKRLR